MPFGLKNAGQAFQRFIDTVCQGLDFVFVYVDDILVASKDAEEHERHLRQLFQRLQEHGLVINVAKCQFLSPFDPGRRGDNATTFRRSSWQTKNLAVERQNDEGF